MTADGTPDTGYTDSVHFTSTDGQAVLPSDSTLTNGTGTFDVILKTAGSQTITVTDTTYSSISGTSAAIAVSPAAADHLVFSQQPTSTKVGAVISPPVTVSVFDHYNNPVDPTSVTISASGGPGTLSGTLTETTTNGVATFSDLSLSDVGTYTLTASVGTNLSVTSNSFNVTRGAAEAATAAETVAATTRTSATGSVQRRGVRLRSLSLGRRRRRGVRARPHPARRDCGALRAGFLGRDGRPV